MNKLIFATVFASLATLAQAEKLQLVNGDGSELSDQCIAAVHSDDIGISPLEKRETLCNNMPMERFVEKMRREIAELETTYVFSMRVESDLTELCMAAVESEEAYLRARTELFGNDRSIDNEVMCNGMAIKAFARKYRNRMTTTAL